MRFLIKYPITADEVTTELKQMMIDVHKDEECGDLAPVIRRGIQTYFLDAANMTQLIAHLRTK